MGFGKWENRVKVWNSVMENENNFISKEHTELRQETWALAF